MSVRSPLGTTIGRYVLKRKLGDGAMGSVYLGEHEVIKSYVAVKVLHPDLCGDAKLVERFFAEARTISHVGHENLVKIFDLGSTEDGRHYFVMEYLNGVTLEDFLARAPIPLEELAPIIFQVIDALAAVHDCGFVHRDLKPANIVLVPIAERLIAKVLDFGVAKLVAPIAPSSRTSENVIIGTPLYMSPEQAMGEALDPRADIYSLGVILYRMATARFPFEERSRLDVMLAHIHGTLTPPSVHNAAITPLYEQLLLKALAKKADDRYSSMRELREAFAQVVALSRPQSPDLFTSDLIRSMIASDPSRAPESPKPRSAVRTDPRARIDLEVIVYAEEGAPVARRTVDLSMSGVFIALDGDAPAIFSKLKLELSAPDGSKLRLRGRVVRVVSASAAEAWNCREGIGVELVDLEPETAAALRALLDQIGGESGDLISGTALLSAEVQAFIDEMNLRGRGHYATLVIDPGSTPEAIRRAMGEVLRTLGEHSAALMAPEAKVRLAEVRASVEEAGRVLLDPKLRAEYDADQRNFRGVAQAFAAGLSPEDGEVLRARFLEKRPGWGRAARAASSESTLSEHSGRTDDARAALELALILDPLNSEYQHRYWGLVDWTGD